MWTAAGVLTVAVTTAAPTPRQVGVNAALVALGSSLGTLLRALVGRAVPHAHGAWPWATMAVNLVGALVLPLLYVWLSRRFAGPRAGLLLGTGVLGGFTTYSAFSVDTWELIRAGRTDVAMLYVAVTVLGGLAISCTMLLLTQPRQAS